jgi:putative transposase
MMLVDRLRDRFGVEPVLWVVGVPVSTFYGWLARVRQPSPRELADAVLAEQIQRVHADSGAT